MTLVNPPIKQILTFFVKGIAVYTAYIVVNPQHLDVQRIRLLKYMLHFLKNKR